MSDRTFSATNPYALLIFTALFWAGNAIAGKLAAGHISPFLLTTGRWTLAILLLLPFAWKYLRKDWETIRSHLVFLALCGAIGFTLFNNFLYMALTYTSAINVTIEQAAMPLVIFVLNYLLFRTRTTLFQAIGFSITLVGVVVTASRGDLAVITNGDFNRGDLLMMFAMLFYGIYSVILRKKPEIHLISFLFVLSCSALLVSLPFTLYESGTEKFIWPDAQGWAVLVYAGVFPSILSQLFWVMGLEKIGSNRGGLFINLVPVFGTVLAILILGEKFELYHAIGFVLVLGGIMLAQKLSASDRSKVA